MPVLSGVWVRADLHVPVRHLPPQGDQVAHAACVTGEPCCFEEQFTLNLSDYYYDYDNEPLRVLTTPSWMRSCLESVGMDGGKARATITILRNVLLETYSFSDLVRDSHNTNSSVDGRYSGKLGVHHVAVRAVDELEAILADSQMPGDQVSSYKFHYGLADTFRRLYDGHTYYTTPFAEWIIYRPVTLVPRLNATGGQEYVLKAMPHWEPGGLFPGWLTAGRYSAVHGMPVPDMSQHKGKVVLAVNGVPVAEYVQARADKMGQIKSASGRVNALLNFDAEPGTEFLSGAPPPLEDTEVYLFADGSTAEWGLTVEYTGSAQVRSIAVSFPNPPPPFSQSLTLPSILLSPLCSGLR